MMINFSLTKQNDGVPVCRIDGKVISIVSIVWRWHTFTDTISDAYDQAMISGYIQGDKEMHVWILDFVEGEYKELIDSKGKEENNETREQ